ncbi:MAG TPA: TetR/AcrR family transcriptional regulator [Trebonia sp.]
MATETSHQRRRNPRGQGDRLRADIIQAASGLLADPAAPPITLRGVARAVGVAATSVYLHFPDTDALVLAVAEEHFSELADVQQAARDAAATPREAVRAMALAYCEFGLANPGLYQVMFTRPLPPVADLRQIPGRRAFEQRTAAIAAALSDTGIAVTGDKDDPDGPAFRASALLWQFLNGAVNLRISRPVFPWPPAEETVTAVVDQILDAAVGRG